MKSTIKGIQYESFNKRFETHENVYNLFLGKCYKLPTYIQICADLKYVLFYSSTLTTYFQILFKDNQHDHVVLKSLNKIFQSYWLSWNRISNILVILEQNFNHIVYLGTEFESSLLKSLNKIVRVSSPHKYESTLVICSIYPLFLR